MDFHNLREEDQEGLERCSHRYKLVRSDTEIITLYQRRMLIIRRKPYTINPRFTIYENECCKNLHIDERDGPDTALMYASSEGHIGMVKTLIESGADVDIDSRIGRSSLTLAICNGNKEIAKMLVYAGAHINKNDYLQLKKMFDPSPQRRMREKIIELIES